MQGALSIQGAVLFVAVGIALISTVTAVRIEGVRLVNGKRATEGRLEVRAKGGNWGTVCDDRFDDDAARVVCAQLGLENSAAITAAKPRAFFGQGTGRAIVLDDVYCKGSEDAIDGCGRRKYGTHNCAHREDVGVVCGATEWSKWYDTDNPSGYADSELSRSIADSDKPCGGTTPIYIQVQVREGRSWKYLLTTDVLIHVGPVYGLVCKGQENYWRGWGFPYCKNFQTRYTIKKGGSVSRSPWINRDNDGGVGDYEWGFRKTDTKWTSQGTSIEFTTIPSSKARSHRGIDRFIHVGAKYGLQCLNEENAILGLGGCRDYRTRYLCYKRK